MMELRDITGNTCTKSRVKELYVLSAMDKSVNKREVQYGRTAEQGI
jgi:hypothetical protein